jgi:hypothetical protein
MKLTREATTAANPDLRGRKHHFIIESATAAELEAMDEILTLAGWENDSCPCYEDGRLWLLDRHFRSGLFQSGIQSSENGPERLYGS